MTTGIGGGLLPATQNALSLLLLAMADDEFVIGFTDSEWTGIAPLLEEDVAMSSIAQDEIGHAQAFYRLLANVAADGRDADAIAFDRPPEGYYHARLLDHARGDWAQTIVRRFLYDTADAVRLDALVESSFEPLHELVAKVRREERYHVMHVTTWFANVCSMPSTGSLRMRVPSSRRCRQSWRWTWPEFSLSRSASWRRAGANRCYRPSHGSTFRRCRRPVIQTERAQTTPRRSVASMASSHPFGGSTLRRPGERPSAGAARVGRLRSGRPARAW